jgi:hypothetical protein
MSGYPSAPPGAPYAYGQPLPAYGQQPPPPQQQQQPPSYQQAYGGQPQYPTMPPPQYAAGGYAAPPQYASAAPPHFAQQQPQQQQQQQAGYGYQPQGPPQAGAHPYAMYGSPQHSAPPPGYQAAYAQPKVVETFPGQPTPPPPPVAAFVAAAPPPAAKPEVRGGWQDVGFMVAFWVHVLAIAGLAFALGVPAVMRDAQRSGADAGRSPLDFNASLFFRVLLLACVVGAVASTAFIAILQRFASSLIYCALYTSLVMQGVFTAVFFALGQVVMGILMLVLFALQCAYVYYVRDRIAFATAHVKAAVASVESHRAVFGVALALVFLQAAWVMVWELASLGVSSSINGAAAARAGNGTAAIAAPANGGGSNGSALGGAAVFGMTVSLYWGTQTFMYVSHFIVAATVGSW